MTDPTKPVTLKEFEYDSAADYPNGIYATEDNIFLTDNNERNIKIHKKHTTLDFNDNDRKYHRGTLNGS